METAYEAVFIVDVNTPDDQYTAVIEKYSGVITRGGGVVDDVDRWEPRRLAYEIKSRREGLYTVVNFTSEPAAKDELDRIFRISDDTLRHIIVKQDKRADRFPSKLRAAEQERRDREAAARAAAAPPQPVTELTAPVVSASENGGGVTEAAGVSDNEANVNTPLPDADNTLAETVENNGGEQA
jgi:small subunit ribosomal protein S6